MKDGAIPSSTEQLIGRRIRERRNAIGLTQKALADHLDVSPQQVQRYEAGINRLSPSLLARIAVRLDCTVGHLFGEAESPRVVRLAAPFPQIRRRYRRRKQA